MKIGDVVVQTGGPFAGEVGVVTSISKKGGFTVSREDGRVRKCRSWTVRLLVDEFASAATRLNTAAGGTEKQFYRSMVEWTRLGQECIRFDLRAQAREICVKTTT